MALKDSVKRFTCAYCGDSYEESIPGTATKSIKILAIGNSFSRNAMEYLWDICHDAGIETVVLGNLYIGSCTLATHWDNISNNKAAYTYDKNTAGTWSRPTGKSVQFALADEEWDIITMQQASGDSGVPSSYSPAMGNILAYLKANKPTSHTKIMWHMTWAYQSDSTHKDFSKYQNNQLNMYQSIVNCVKTLIEPNDHFSGIIPSGTAIQNLRTSYLGDTLTQDGYHLNASDGKYTAALTWFAYLTGGSIDSVAWIPPSQAAVAGDIAVIREAVDNALKAPLEITPSKYSEISDALRFQKLGLNIADYTLLDWQPTLHSYYNSTTGINQTNTSNSTASNLTKYTSSCLLRKEQLPVGSVIIVDQGYQYRPEGWVSETSTNASEARPANVSTTVVLADANWWGSYQIRAFNLSRTDSRAMTAADNEHFRIYVPSAN